MDQILTKADFAGTVEAVGAGVTTLLPGAEVYSSSAAGGAYVDVARTYPLVQAGQAWADSARHHPAPGGEATGPPGAAPKIHSKIVLEVN